MATKKAAKTKKQITEIDDAKVKIEVDEIEDNDKKKEDEVEEEVAETEEVEETEETPEDDIDEVEDKDKEDVDSWDDEPDGKFSWKKVFLFTFLAAAIGTLIVVGYYIFTSGYTISIEKQGSEQSKEIDIPEVTPTPTETPDSVNKEAYEITILNGSGIAGEAANVQELLEDDDFVVAEIGNADSADYLDTQILAQDDVDEEFLDMLLEALEERGPTEIDDAPSDQTEDVVVIVGSELTDETADLDLE